MAENLNKAIKELELTSPKGNTKVPEDHVLCYWKDPVSENHKVTLGIKGHAITYEFNKTNKYTCAIPKENANTFESTKSHPIYKVAV